MKSRKQLLRKSRLYLILNRDNQSRRSLENICSDLIYGKVDLIQLRDKIREKSEVSSFALKLAKHLESSRIIFIVNDYVDIALACGADGVHLGQDDMPIKKARAILGKDKIIGISCHCLSDALKAQKEGADYIGIGPVFATVTKPQYKAIGLETLAQLAGKIKIPYFAIGDVHEGNIKDILSSGAKRIAVVRAILEAKNPVNQAARLYRLLEK
jgi:thiamine-phosphate pyrophosphorylase